MTQLTQQEFIDRGNKVHNNKFDYSLLQYIKSGIKVKIICPFHGEFEQVPESHLRGKGCLKCKHDLKRKDVNLFIDQLNKIHNFKYDYSQLTYKSNKLKIKIICKLHGEFFQMAHDHLRGYGCPICKTSRGELQIRKLLEENNIKFIPQKTFDGCKGKRRKLPFDFYLPDYNTCIEYQGEHHYKEIKYWGGKEKTERTLITDKIKKEFCFKSKINFVEIYYR